jgi:hypothetical protein
MPINLDEHGGWSFLQVRNGWAIFFRTNRNQEPETLIVPVNEFTGREASEDWQEVIHIESLKIPDEYYDL